MQTKQTDTGCEAGGKTELAYIKGWQSSKRNEVKMKIKEQVYCVCVTESDNFNPSALQSTIAGVFDTEKATKKNLSVLLKIRSMQ